MRLIDADALNLDYEVDMADDWKTAHEITNHIRYAPTVEAIPVEWLKNYAHCTLTDSCQDHIIVGWCEQLLNDWSEEKETEHYEKVLEKRK